MVMFLYDYKLNTKYNNAYDEYYYYIEWIPFNEFRNVRYLAKGDFGEVHKATWINYDYDGEEREVVLKRIYNSSDKISDILKEVKKFNFNTNLLFLKHEFEFKILLSLHFI